jgi:uncharacterized protein YukE
MVIEVHTDELLAAADQLRRVGRRVTSYGHQLGARVQHAGAELDADVSTSLTAAWSELSLALENLALGFERYGGALAQVAERYREADRGATIRRAPGGR